jgi:hypothetical protein
MGSYGWQKLVSQWYVALGADVMSEGVWGTFLNKTLVLVIWLSIPPCSSKAVAFAVEGCSKGGGYSCPDGTLLLKFTVDVTIARHASC